MAFTVKSEGPVRITKATIEASWRRRAAGQRLVLRDAECRGLSLIINTTSMTWRFDFRPRGTDPDCGRRWPMQSITIGNPATHSPDDARIAAQKLKGQAAAGLDPAAVKRIAAAAEQRKRAKTLGRLLEEYAVRLPARPKLRGTGLPSVRHSREEVRRARAAIESIEAMQVPVAELTTDDVRRAVDGIASRPSVARSQFGSLSRFLDWCIEEKHIDLNPCALVTKARRPKGAPPRQHYLRTLDLAKLWRSAEGLRHPVWRDIARFLIAVPCRRGEAAHLDWSHLDLNKAEWRQPGRLTKNGEPHRLHLHPLALDLLRQRWMEAQKPRTGLVFSSPEAAKPLQTFSAMQEALGHSAGVTGWRWHDFRRSFATALAEAGTPEVVADAVLNHKQSATRGGVLGIYQQATRWPEQVKAMQVWGRMLEGEISGASPGAVVPLLARQAGVTSEGDRDATVPLYRLGLGPAQNGEQVWALVRSLFESIAVPTELSATALAEMLKETADAVDHLLAEQTTGDDPIIIHSSLASALRILGKMLADIPYGITDPVIKAPEIGGASSGYRLRFTSEMAFVLYKLLIQKGFEPEPAYRRIAEIMAQAGHLNRKRQPISPTNVKSWVNGGLPGKRKRKDQQ